MSPETGYRKGRRAEILAAWYLRFKGYHILAMRYKTRVGEIDLIARRGGSIVFTEVKWRTARLSAMEAIHQDNQTRVRRAAELYLQKHPRYTGHAKRFDALVFAPGQWPLHIKNAF
jgi:putative endonuclease